MYANYANVARQRIRGFDLSGSYRMDLGPGQLALQGSASWLDSSQQSVPGAETYDLSGVLFGPPRFKSRVGGVWRAASVAGISRALRVGLSSLTAGISPGPAATRRPLASSAGEAAAWWRSLANARNARCR